MQQHLHTALRTTRNFVLSPLRNRRLDQLCDAGQAPCMVAFYHRVADHHRNDWTLPRAEFKRHLDHFEKHCRCVDLAEIQRRVREGQSNEPAICVTFDDGYQENAEFALPLLVERRIPCTYFISTQHILKQVPFDHDVQAGTPLPVHTAREIRQWSDAGIEIGCHTRHHVNFHRLDDRDKIREEIVVAKEEVEQITGKRCRYFAFPFGMPDQLTQAAIETVYEAGFEGFCSAYGAYNQIGGDWFHLRRFHGDPEFSRLCNWTAYDQRKVKRQPFIRYSLPPARSFEETQDQLNAIALGTSQPLGPPLPESPLQAPSCAEVPGCL